MPVKGAAGIMLADARAAVRNSASRRVIGPVICFEDETAGAPEGYDASGTPASRRCLRMSGRAREAHLRGAGQMGCICSAAILNKNSRSMASRCWFRRLAPWQWGCIEGVKAQQRGGLDAFLPKAAPADLSLPRWN